MNSLDRKNTSTYVKRMMLFSTHMHFPFQCFLNLREREKGNLTKFGEKIVLQFATQDALKYIMEHLNSKIISRKVEKINNRKSSNIARKLIRIATQKRPHYLHKKLQLQQHQTTTLSLQLDCYIEDASSLLTVCIEMTATKCTDTQVVILLFD